jgi:hypothetical protein
MAKGKRNVQSFERGPASDVWRHTLSQIPHVLGRLVYLASLRNPNNGQYEHHGLAQIYGAEKAHATLLTSHESSFSEWLNYDLVKQEGELRLQLAGLDGQPKEIAAAWLQLGTYRNWMPITASEAQRALYLMDLEALLGRLKDGAA